ncbi:MAG TPA: photosynthetic reaction center cytochrome c subunit family protein [Gemmatimonadaceae bacterium]|nr:photosynthetic reaction center cytochrome c subunit family protein [Gemmatimonadaceae bacterium]
MAVRRVAVVLGSLVAILSCTHGGATPAPAPGAGPAAAPAPNQPGAGEQVVRRFRMPPPRDSMAKLRATYVAQIMQQIAGREDEPDTVVFKNVQVLKNLTARQLVDKMDKDYGEALSWNCVNCHRLANQGNWASDTSADKRRARAMQLMTNEINDVELPKIYQRDPPHVDCATCHRGYNEPPPPRFLIPERGKPGGLPMPNFNRGRGGPPPRAPGH